MWGAQRGTTHDDYAVSGYRGYSIGTTYLTRNNTLYINVGGEGKPNNNSNSTIALGGYNGGGDGGYHEKAAGIYGNISPASGGGATHIATKSGELKELSPYKGIFNENKKIYISDTILIVAGGGGGAYFHDNFSRHSYGFGGSGSGFYGVNGKYNNSSYSYGIGGTQEEAGTTSDEDTIIAHNLGGFGFGAKGIGTASNAASCGRGGGFYGGGYAAYAGCGGGSGYIGNSLLTNKVMYVYCEDSTDDGIDDCVVYKSSKESIRTETTTNVSDTAISNYAK